MPLSDNTTELDFIRQYCSESSFKKNLSKNTTDAYMSDLKVYLQWLRSNEYSLLDADREIINNYLAFKLDSGLSVSTIQRTITCIKSFYLFLHDNHLIKNNPSTLIENPKKRRKLPTIISESEIEKLLSAPNDKTATGLRDKCILELLYSSGLRISELLTIKINQITTDKPYLRIRGKGNKERLVPIGSFAMKLLISYIDGYRTSIKSVSHPDILFINSNGSVISTQACWEMIQKYA